MSRRNYRTCADLSLSAMQEQDPKRIADELIKSISEDPRVEPGQADTTPANEEEDESQEDRAQDEAESDQA